MSTDGFTCRVWSVARHNVVLLSRDPGQMFGYTVMPLLMMIALRPVYIARGDEASGTVQATIGPMVLFSLITLNVIGHSTLNERTWHTWDRLRASPASGAELLLGKSAPFYLMLLVQQTIILTCAVVVFDLRINGSSGILATIPVMLVWSATVLALGTLLATMARTHGQLNTITDIGAFAVTVIGGGITPLSTMPDWMRMLAPYTPGYWAMAGYRTAFSGDDLGAMVTPLAVLLSITVVAGVTATLWAARRSDARQ